MLEIRFIYFDIQPSFSSIPPQMRSFSPIYTYNIYYIIIAFIFTRLIKYKGESWSNLTPSFLSPPS